MSKASAKDATSETTNYFVAKELKTPSKDLPGISKTVYTHLASFHGLLKDWMRIQEKGTKICKAVHALKLHECNDDYYPSQLSPLTESLLDALDGLKHIVEGTEIINKQLKAVSKLQPTDEPVIFTWSAEQISKEVDENYINLLKEYRLKHTVTENLAHCREEALIDVYVASWEFNVYINIESTGYLFSEVGLSGII